MHYYPFFFHLLFHLLLPLETEDGKERMHHKSRAFRPDRSSQDCWPTIEVVVHFFSLFTRVHDSQEQQFVSAFVFRRFLTFMLTNLTRIVFPSDLNRRLSHVSSLFFPNLACIVFRFYCSLREARFEDLKMKKKGSWDRSCYGGAIFLKGLGFSVLI